MPIAFILLASLGYAQKVTVTRQNEKIKTETVEVFAVALEGGKEEVNSSAVKFLKEVGKTRQGTEFTTVTDPVLNGMAYPKKVFYAFTKGDEKNSTTWFGAIPGEWDANEISTVNRELEKLAYQFGIRFYQDRVQALIDEAQQALEAVERKQQRLVNQNKDLNTKLVNNEQEKIRLEKAINDNSLEHAVLLQKIENNKKAQDSVANATIQIKKMVETHKAKFRSIN